MKLQPPLLPPPSWPMKPTAQLLASPTWAMKPPSPMRAQNTRKTHVFPEQRWRRFHPHTKTRPQRCHRFQASAHTGRRGVTGFITTKQCTRYRTNAPG